MGLTEILVGVIGLGLVIWLAYAVDKRSSWDKDLEDEDIEPLLGVVAPKKEEKKEK